MTNSKPIKNINIIYILIKNLRAHPQRFKNELRIY